MKKIKYIFRILVIILISVYLFILTLSNLTPLQRWLGGVVASSLSDYLETEVRISSIKPGMLNRLHINDLCIYDQQDSLMLKATRVAAKVDIMPLITGKIHINNAQLFGSSILLYQDKEEAPLNCQFLIDALKSKDDSKKSNLDLKIGSFLIRRCRVRYDQHYHPITPDTFNIHHLDISNINLNATVHCLTPDSQSISIKHLSFNEQSGIALKNLAFDLQATQHGANLDDFEFAAGNSMLSIPHLDARFDGIPNKQNMKAWLKQLSCNARLEADLRLADLKAIMPALKHYSDPLHLQTNLICNNGTLSTQGLQLESGKDISINGDLHITNLNDKPNYCLLIQQLNTSSDIQHYLTRNLQGESKEISPILTQIGATKSSGKLIFRNNTLEADLKTQTSQGNIEVMGKLAEKNDIDATIRIEKFNLGKSLQNQKIDIANLTMRADVRGKLKDSSNKPSLVCKADIEQVRYNNYIYRNILADATIDGKIYTGRLDMSDTNGSVHLAGEANLTNPQKHIVANASFENLSPYNMNLVKKYENDRFSGKIETDIFLTNIDNISGQIDIIDPIITTVTDEVQTIAPGNLHIQTACETNEKHINISSKPLNLQADGQFRWQDVPNIFLNITHDHLPSIFSSPKAYPLENTDIKFAVAVQDTLLFTKLLNTSIKIPERAVMQGDMSNETATINFKANIPQLEIAGQDLRQIAWTMNCNKKIIQTSLIADRMSKGKPIAINLNAYASEDKLNTKLNWTNNAQPANEGSISLTGQLHHDLSGKQSIQGMINASTIVINDTIWNVSPSFVNYHDKVIDIENFRISTGERYITLNGRASAEPTDTLTADLKEINLAYIFNIVNFHAVEFNGRATGRAYAHSLMKKPIASAFLHVSDFTFNEALLGDMDVYGNWGDREKSITLNAMIKDLAAGAQTTVDGYVTPGRNPQGSLELNVKTKRINIGFLNKYTSSFMRNIQGRASGWARIFGPFKDINIEGDLKLDEASMHVVSLGVDYHLGGDSVILRPDNIWLRDATIYDPYAAKGKPGHSAKVNGHMMHKSLGSLRYNFEIEADNLLGYNFHDFGDLNFYGTVYATGQVQMAGQPGSLNIDVRCTPQPGSLMVYNASTPEAITEAGFVTYVTPKDTAEIAIEETKEPEVENTSMDMRINFNLDITPNATLRLLMDTKTDDMINLFGNGHILANYYNKGKFQMFGTYRVDHGLYKMSVQDFIHKDFQFQPGGTIVFGGDAYQAALNLKAAYTVPNVSLDDLASTGLGLSNTRVNCIMNIGGKAKEPLVTFDFDIPNANEDEKQMIRSLISTEEEKNMQVIYLLGLGRFYSYENQYAGQGNQQSGMAVNSFLSNTLSNRVNQIMSNALGTSNWSFGTNLRTGENGWDQLDVEGLLSGRMFNNRLLINGNFGYRESMYTTNKSNFIGDFDIRYLLTPRGSYSLKAYNQTNDRYFTQSSLTTQGIGIQFKHDFNNWKEAFKRSKKNKK